MLISCVNESITMAAQSWIIFALDIIPVLFTIIGNAVFFITIMKTSTLHTPSNILLAFLSATDFMVGVLCQPLFIVSLFEYSVPCCTRVMHAYNFIFYLTSWNSFLCIVVITVDRYCAVFYPYKYREKASCRKFCYMTTAFLAVSGIYSTIHAMFYERAKTGFLVFHIAFHSSILILTITLYSLVLRVVIRQRKSMRLPLQQHARRKIRRKQQAEKGRAYTIALILLALVISTTPHIFYEIKMLLVYSNNSKFIQGFGKWVNFLFLLNSAFNPLIYFLKRNDIRRAACRMLRRSCHRNANNPQVSRAKTPERRKRQSRDKDKNIEEKENIKSDLKIDQINLSSIPAGSNEK